MDSGCHGFGHISSSLVLVVDVIAKVTSAEGAQQSMREAYRADESAHERLAQTIQAATPYLILAGRARRALDLYASALGARAEVVQRFGDVDQSCPQARRDLVMHASLRVGNALIMLSDGPEEAPAPAGPSAVSVALDFDDEAELRRCFDALAVGGQPIMPVMDAPWGALFGVVQDELGVSWMLNCSKRGS